MAKKAKIGKRIIFTDSYDVDDYRVDFEDYCDINGISVFDADINEFASECQEDWLMSERDMLSKPCGTILCIADLGVWNGRRSAYRILKGGKLNSIFDVMGSDYDATFYVDRYDVKAELAHHDGTNYVTFRIIKDGVNPQPLLDALFFQEEVTSRMISKYTKSMRKMVNEVYGW